jgi:hypothetical protein
MPATINHTCGDKKHNMNYVDVGSNLCEITPLGVICQVWQSGGPKGHSSSDKSWQHSHKMHLPYNSNPNLTHNEIKKIVFQYSSEESVS